MSAENPFPATPQDNFIKLLFDVMELSIKDQKPIRGYVTFTHGFKSYELRVEVSPQSTEPILEVIDGK